ncbi:hypothetical protein R75461_08442 [Paraburkholderia nemoris]|uniref:hypothetical protein n=1 Tax=Paraburkholderia nemoris TaxID=2793076 RepID=UPI00190C4B86|nr:MULTISPECIES: hypothetical protein [Paraburkholderia]MBK3787221.1 hypothetical protein [Paraburkholderia aspalathi]CAE6868640.1 hypothetical protein R75461_08442 [Paraburkholderia nemoris]
MSHLSTRLLMTAGSFAYGPVVLAANPYAYWRLNETAGTVATDSSGHARHGTYVAPVALAYGALLPAAGKKAYLGLSGPGSGYVDVSAATQFCAGGDWSLECWANLISFSQPNNYGCTFMASSDPGTAVTGWAIGASSSPVGALMYYTKNPGNLGVDGTVPAVKLMHFVAV